MLPQEHAEAPRTVLAKDLESGRHQVDGDRMNGAVRTANLTEPNYRIIDPNGTIRDLRTVLRRSSVWTKATNTPRFMLHFSCIQYHELVSSCTIPARGYLARLLESPPI